MTIAEVQKTRWIEQATDQAASLLEQQMWAESAEEAAQSLSFLITELKRSFHALTQELKAAYSPAAAEFYEWAISHSSTLDGLFTKDPEKLLDKPWELTEQVQAAIPYKYIEYLFNAAKCLYFKNEFVKADRAFRLLTFLYPQKAEFWIWLGFTQQVRKLAELAIVSFTIASKLTDLHGDLLFYMGQCWILLQNWDFAEKVLLRCLIAIDDNVSEAARLMKQKCEELLSLINQIREKTNSKTRVSITMSLFSGTSKEAVETIRLLHTATRVASAPRKLQEADWSAMIASFETELREVTAQLQSVRERFSPHLKSFGFFESSTFTFKEDSIEVPIKPLAKLSTLAATLFLGALDIGMQVAAEHKRLQEALEAHRSLQLGHDFAKSLDACEKPGVRAIVKHLYFYNSRLDMALSEWVSDPIYGYEEYSYQETQREDSAIRASLFRIEDIVGKSLLDFGCNEGAVLFACRRLGAGRITGIDLNSWGIDEAKSYATKHQIPDAHFYLTDMENKAFLSTLEQADTVFLLAILDTSYFLNKTAVLATTSQFAKHVFYYQGHINDVSHVQRMYELLITTNFTRFEYLGRSEGRVLIRCSRELFSIGQVPEGAITSDASNSELLSAPEIYLFSDAEQNPSFSAKCRLIQFVKR